MRRARLCTATYRKNRLQTIQTYARRTHGGTQALLQLVMYVPLYAHDTHNGERGPPPPHTHQASNGKAGGLISAAHPPSLLVCAPVQLHRMVAMFVLFPFPLQVFVYRVISHSPLVHSTIRRICAHIYIQCIFDAVAHGCRRCRTLKALGPPVYAPSAEACCSGADPTTTSAWTWIQDAAHGGGQVKHRHLASQQFAACCSPCSNFLPSFSVSFFFVLGFLHLSRLLFSRGSVACLVLADEWCGGACTTQGPAHIGGVRTRTTWNPRAPQSPGCASTTQ